MATAAGETESYDYIVVGAGSAGAAVAARLSQDASVSVLLLEAGKRDRHPGIHIPAAFSELFRSAYDWNFSTVPQDGLAGRSIYWPRGRMLGGSSSLNAMMWVRGFAADYDGWSKVAGPTWSWSALLPYFRQVERFSAVGRADLGTGGALWIEDQRSPRSHTATFLTAVQQAGFPVEAANLPSPRGFTRTMVSQHRGARFSSADGYLRPARGRANLTVRTGAQVSRVLFSGPRAVGVEYLDGRTPRQVTARSEVVLAGGAVNTPQLLLMSGIGPAEHLRDNGIEVLVDSPEVGANLRDHLIAGLVVRTTTDTLFAAKKIGQLANYLIRRRGMLTSNVAEAYGFVRTRPELDLPDVEIIFAPVAYVGQGLVPPPAHGFTVGAILLQPHSSGRVQLASADPTAAPRIDPAYLSDPGGADRATLTAGLGICQQLLDTPALRAAGTGHYLAPLGAESMTPAERFDASIDDHSHTLYHPVGTARMGLDVRSVVDPELRVRGVSGLRVADASVMPNIIRGHTHAPSVVIGEKAADLILTDGR